MREQPVGYATGPTWRRRPNGTWDAPEWTLGFDVIRWCSRYLLQPDGDRAGRPWKFTPEQGRFVLWWYAVNSEGKFVHRRGILRRRKGWGKDPFSMALGCCEWLGPCRFGGWRPNGEPIAVPVHTSRVQLCAVSMHQAKRNSMSLLPAMLSPRARDEYGVDLGLDLSRAKGGLATFELVTSSPTSLEGARPTFVVKNETQNWFAANLGHDMAAVIDRNLGKAPDGSARALAICNAHVEGLDSDAERDYLAYQAIVAGEHVDVGYLYDSLEAPPGTLITPEPSGPNGEITPADIAARDESLRVGLAGARGDSYWLDDERTVAEILDPKSPAVVSRRFYLNQVGSPEDAWIAPHEWDACRVPPREVADGEIVVLGFDGSKSGDHTVLDAIRVEDGYAWPLGVWDPALYADHVIPTVDVDALVQAAFEKFDVVGFYADREGWESYIDAWEQRYGGRLCARATDRKPISWDMRGGGVRVLRAVESYRDAIVERHIAHGGEPRMDRYHYNARLRESLNGVSYGKGKSGDKVDGVSARMLAWQARQDYLALPENRRRNTRRAGVMFV